MKFKLIKRWKVDDISRNEWNSDVHKTCKYDSNGIMRLIKNGYEVSYINGLYYMKRTEKVGISSITTHMIFKESY